MPKRDQVISIYIYLFLFEYYYKCQVKLFMYYVSLLCALKYMKNVGKFYILLDILQLIYRFHYNTLYGLKMILL